MKTLVWRLESKESGYGIYRDEELFHVSDKWTCSSSGDVIDAKKHPLPANIWPSWTTEVNQHLFFFGFISLQSMYDWVNDEEWRKALHDNGAVLKVYEVDLNQRHYSSDTQIAFKIDVATLLETFDEGEWVVKEEFINSYEEVLSND